MEKLNINARNIESHRQLLEELEDTQRDHVVIEESKMKDQKENTNISICEQNEQLFGSYESLEEENNLVNQNFEMNSHAATHMQKNSPVQEAELTPLEDKKENNGSLIDRKLSEGDVKGSF